MRRIMMMMALTVATALQANAMSYTDAQREALFLTDKMTYELGLSQAQADAVFEINLDYMLSVSTPSLIYGTYWARRNQDLRYVLSPEQYHRYQALGYFYKPVAYSGNRLSFVIYNRYANRSLFYRARPTNYASYRGGNNRKYNSVYANRTFTAPQSNRAYHRAQQKNWRGAGNQRVSTRRRTATKSATITRPATRRVGKNTATKSGTNHSRAGRNGLKR